MGFFLLKNQEVEMAKMSRNWAALSVRYEKEHEQIGITVKKFCEKYKLVYNTAKRYIKPEANNLISDVRKFNAAQKSFKEGDMKSKVTENQDVKDEKSKTDHSEYDRNRWPSGKPDNRFGPGNQAARTYGHYSEFVSTDQDIIRYASAENANLHDELVVLRMQLSNLLFAIKSVERQLVELDCDVNQIIALNNILNKHSIDSNAKFARIESIEIAIVNIQKIVTDTERSKSAKRKIDIDADKAAKETGESTGLNEIYNHILAMNNNGMLNDDDDDDDDDDGAE